MRFFKCTILKDKVGGKSGYGYRLLVKTGYRNQDSRLTSYLITDG
jgi:hypothetical protein